MEKFTENLLIFIGGVVIVAGIWLLLAFPIKWCWNATMPFIFGFPIISWGKAWCLGFLANSLVKSSVSSK